MAAHEVAARETPVFGGHDDMVWEYRVREAIQRPVTLHFEDASLHEVLSEFERQIRVPIALDVRALEDAGLDGETLVTVQCDNVSARQALESILRYLDLGWFTQRMLVVTTREKCDEHLIVRVYPVADFLTASSDGQGSEGEGFQELADTISSTVAPETWDTVGGQGAMRWLHSAGAMVVSQTRDVHEDIEDLLYALRAARYGQRLSPDSPADIYRQEWNRLLGHQIRAALEPPAGSLEHPPRGRAPIAVFPWQLPRLHD
jgi:hypothetical protein